MIDRFTPKTMRFDGTPTPSQMEAWLLRHPFVLLGCVIACLWISLSLIFRLWSKSNPDRTIRKMLWSFILFLPFFGWIFYGGFYRPPQLHSEKPSVPPRKGKRLFP